MRRVIVGISAAAGLMVASLGAPATAAAGPPGQQAGAGFVFSASAFGTFASVGHVVSSGRSASVQIGCTTAGGVRHTNNVAGVDASPLLHTGSVVTSAASRRNPVQSKGTATTQHVSLLSGLVSATAIEASSSTRHRNGGGFRTSAAGTTFTSLVVAGIPVTGTVDPNTRLDLAGFGYLVLNEQNRHVGQQAASLTVNGLHLVIDEDNVLGIPVGTNIVVSHAFSGLSGPAAAAIDGFSYGSSLRAAATLSSGRTFPVSLPCDGTNGRIKTNEGAGVSLPGVLTTGAIHDTAVGTVSASNAEAETTSSIDSTSVLDTLVTATVITADAHASSDGQNSTVSDAGSSFGTLAVAGFPEIGPDVAPNTRLRIAGIGVLWLHRTITTGSSIEVRMIELIVKNPANPVGLPLGADLRLAVAKASTHR